MMNNGSKQIVTWIGDSFTVWGQQAHCSLTKSHNKNFTVVHGVMSDGISNRYVNLLGENHIINIAFSCKLRRVVWLSSKHARREIRS